MTTKSKSDDAFLTSQASTGPKTTAGKKRKKQLEDLAIIMVPWLTFSMIVVMSTMVQEYAGFSYAFGSVAVFMSALFIAIGCMSGSSGTVPIALGSMSLLAAALAVPISSKVRADYMQEYWHLSGGATYHGVSPATSGSAESDAAIIEFIDGAGVDLQSSAGFMKAGVVYCAAPVYTVASQKMTGAYFWAVGLNCCDARGRFMCGPVADTGIHTALGVYDDTENYAKAVKMARSIYSLDPAQGEDLLVSWHADPASYIETLVWTAASVVTGSVLLHLMGSVGAWLVVRKQLTLRAARAAHRADYGHTAQA